MTTETTDDAALSEGAAEYHADRADRLDRDVQTGLAWETALREENAKLQASLLALVIAIDPDESGGTCRACQCEDAEYDEPHSMDCAYMLARRQLGRGPVEEGGSAVCGDPGERIGVVEG
jgi:hypothetical protein